MRVTLVQEYFHPWPNSAGFHLARARGWYAELGIDLELRTPDPGRGDGLGYLARAEADLAVVPSNRLLVRREAGEPLVAIAAVNQRGLETLRTRRDSGIERLGQLQGRRVALNPTPRGLAIVRALIASDGGDPADFVVVDAGARELDPADGFGGRADASFGSYWAWDVLLSALPPEQERSWRVDDALGLRYHSYLLAAREERVERDRALLEDLLAVTERGFRAAAAEPDAAAAVLERVIPYFPERVIRRSLAAIAPTWAHEGRWGAIRAELVGPYARWLADAGILRSPERWPEALHPLAPPRRATEAVAS
ncbi:MAG: ABC transporter substrate-binding protein [Microbacteriaceae bacterium]